jgi:hypothetical protein
LAAGIGGSYALISFGRNISTVGLFTAGGAGDMAGNVLALALLVMYGDEVEAGREGGA